MRLMPSFKRAGKSAPKRVRAENRRHRLMLRAGFAAGTLAALAGGGWYLTSIGWVDAQAEAARQAVVDASARAGLRVDDVILSGRKNAEAGDILAALDVARGTPMLDLDIEAARARLEALGWVASADIARRLPDIVFVRVVEREPLALWQHEGDTALVDRSGEIIQRTGLDRFADLPLIVGEGAPRHAADLLDLLRTFPAVDQALVAAVRVSNRRWNLRLDRGIDVRLPESELTRALARLDEFQRDHALLERDVVAVDLRVPDRLIVRVDPEAAARAREEEKDT